MVCDRVSQCAAFGELRCALDAGYLAADAVPELGRIIAGLAPGRTTDDEITIVDLTGVGFQDTAIASYVFQQLAVTKEQP